MDPVNGRFLSADPIGFQSGQLNKFGYTAGKPVNAVDPSGLQPPWLTLGGRLSVGRTSVLRSAARFATLSSEEYIDEEFVPKNSSRFDYPGQTSQQRDGLGRNASKFRQNRRLFNKGELEGELPDLETGCPGKEFKIIETENKTGMRDNHRLRDLSRGLLPEDYAIFAKTGSQEGGRQVLELFSQSSDYVTQTLQGVQRAINRFFAPGPFDRPERDLMS